MGRSVRYDSAAEWYVEFTKDWGTEPQALLPGDLRGQRILDLACGYGVASRWLAEHGAQVTGVDLSARLLARARQLESDQPLGAHYVQGDATSTHWWDGEPFDGVLCNMALMDIDDLGAALSTVTGVLTPGGWFTFSIFHPCYPGETESLPSWPPDRGYSHEGWWSTQGEGIRGRVGANHRRLSTYLNAVLGAGLTIEETAERGNAVPVIFITRCVLSAQGGRPHVGV